MTSILQELSARFSASIDDEIKGWLCFEEDEHAMRNMLRYQMGYIDQTGQPGPGGGKRFRPILSLLAAEAVGGEWNQVLPLAAAIELLHNFSLIHDDIEDQDPSRRHRPTVWKVWGEAQAINAGDGMFALAGRAALATGGPESALEIACRFQDTVLRLTEGQYLDLRFETEPAVAVADYVKMIGLKTSALIAFSLWAGATAGGGSNATRQALDTFGYELGLAFQIRDDIMGIWAESSVTGKEAAKDLVNRKKTLPVLVAFQRADAQQRAVLENFYRRCNEDLMGVLDVLAGTDAEREATAAVNEHRDRALTALEEADLRPVSTDTLARLAAELTGD